MLTLKCINWTSKKLCLGAIRYMQGVTTDRHSGLTEAVASRSFAFRLTKKLFGNIFLPRFDIWTKEFKIFPTLFFGFDKPAMAIANLAHLLLPFGQANTLAKANKLNSYRTKQFGAPTKSRGVFAHLLPVGQSACHGRAAFYIFQNSTSNYLCY